MGLTNCVHYSACFSMVLQCIPDEVEGTYFFDEQCKDSCIWYEECNGIIYLLDKYTFKFMQWFAKRNK
jgi:hypothetical protein